VQDLSSEDLEYKSGREMLSFRVLDLWEDLGFKHGRNSEFLDDDYFYRSNFEELEHAVGVEQILEGINGSISGFVSTSTFGEAYFYL
jgi:hypothetical protein